MIKEIFTSIIGGAVVATAGYLLIIKENQVRIEYLTKEISELKTVGTATLGSLSATKLFIVAAHPDRDASTLASVYKLRMFTLQDFEALGSGLAGGKGSIELKKLMSKHSLNNKDITVYTAIANSPVSIN